MGRDEVRKDQVPDLPYLNVTTWASHESLHNPTAHDPPSTMTCPSVGLQCGSESLERQRALAQSATQYSLPLVKIDLAIATVPLLELFGSLVHAAALADAAQVQLQVGGLGGAVSESPGGLFPQWAAQVSSGNLDGSASLTTTYRFMSSPLSCTCLQGLCC